MLSKGREMAADTVVLTVRLPVALQQQLDTVAQAEDPMEFHTEREETLYTTLKQVLQNHISNHRLGYHETLSACVSVLGYVLYVMSDDWDEAPALIESTVAELKQRTQARVLRACPALPPFHDYGTRAAMTELGHDIGTALATFLATSGIEHNMSVAATWRAYLSLVADVLAMPLHDSAHTPAEVDAEIDTLRDELPVVMHLWAEEAR
jgi:hypothetical protein